MSAPRHSTPLVRVGPLVLALAMCASLGLHWASLQAVAWTRMLVTYSQYVDFGEAVKKTFDGAHPCDLCLPVKHGQSGEKDQEIAPLSKQLDAVLAWAEAAPIRFVQTQPCALPSPSCPKTCEAR